MSIKYITSDNFEQLVMESDKLVVLDFYATWCGPCRAIGPVVDELAEQYSESVVIGKVNVDEESALSRKYKVMSIPTIILLKNGEIVDKVVGLHSKEDLIELIDSNK